MSLVTVKLMGGLGNQLFQYAAARAISLRSGAKTMLDISGYNSDGLRRFELADFSIRAGITSKNIDEKSGMRIFFKRLLRSSDALTYKERFFHYDNHFTKLKPPVVIEGYWQSERYFSEFSNIIRSELELEFPFGSPCLDIAARIIDTLSVSVHIRRGDYVSDAKTNSYHGVCSLEYYKRAIEFIRTTLGKDVHLFVFSDDFEWTIQNIKSDFPITYVSSNRSSHDMKLMAMCQHNIIANSSFSWWAAWLNPRADKIVVAPRNWFANSENNTRDLMPATWTLL